ncbi:uncharacterized protein LOC112092119 [Morus notabilis]|uniref:uncharacterized protein LOC112092119 n=1 Tax=Morus notabilis TaxID=981085 RepID=UPI000CED3E06|nr:uncharacterized protein LOC112092119 [Morus notabilis]
MAEEDVQGNLLNLGQQLIVLEPVQRPFLVDDHHRAIRDFAVPVLDGLNPVIVQPNIEAQYFELKLVIFQMLQTVGQFSGMAADDPHLHLRLFMEVSDIFKLPGVPLETLRLTLFPYSLRDRARAWFNSLPADSIITWNDLAEKFLMKYFLPIKNAKLRNDITSFHQSDGESVYAAWERFKELFRKCPLHGIQMETFYNGLNEQTRVMVDAAANGALLAKSYNEGYEILERMATNHYQWPTKRLPTRKTPGVLEVDAITALSAQVSNLTNMIITMNTSTGGHLFEGCPLNPASACYVSNYNQNNAYSHQYNQGWRQHPNFSWSNQGAGSSGAPPSNRPAQPSGLPQPAQPMRIQAGENSNSLENLLKEYIMKNEAKMQSQDATLRSLETQIGQLANALTNRPQGTLPSNTENPRQEGKEHCKAILLRSGKALEQPQE